MGLGMGLIIAVINKANSPVESILESFCDGGKIRGKSDDSAVVLHHVQRDWLPKLVGFRQTRDGGQTFEDPLSLPLPPPVLHLLTPRGGCC